MSTWATSRKPVTPGGGAARLRLRKRLLVGSAPVVIVALLAAGKMISAVIAGDAAVSDFRRHDAAALRDDISTLSVLNAIEPDTAAFARGDLAALDGKLGEADSRFTDVLSRTGKPRSCPVRVNTELVRETRGDLAARDGKPDQAEQRYRAALAVTGQAPARCFEGNDDPDPDRRLIRNDAAARLAEKIRALHAPPPPAGQAPPGGQAAAPPPPPAAQPAGPSPPPASPAAPGSGSALDSGGNPDKLPGSGPAPALRLDPGRGNPLDRLHEALANSDEAAQPGD